MKKRQGTTCRWFNWAVSSCFYDEYVIEGHSLVKYHPNALSSLVIGGWDIENGLPEGPDGKLDFDTFFAYAKITAPELTDWITSDIEPAVRAYFDAISSYDGFYDSARLTQNNMPKLFWAGLEDVYYQQLNSWAEANKYTFISATGDHVSAILKPEPAIISEICKFVEQAEHQISI
ncbi:hypothetical protein [Erwinia rhapontici]|uniref:hypothetical protein n=1 Tax=Erwinia rhapontici TaxID=55212 RepID=UPI003BA08777